MIKNYTTSWRERVTMDFRKRWHEIKSIKYGPDMYYLLTAGQWEKIKNV